MNDNKIIIGQNRNASILLNGNAEFSPADKAELEKLSKAFLSGASAPTTETETTVLGAVYVTASGNVYHCTNIDGNVFTWEKFIKITDYPSTGNAGVIQTSTVLGTTVDSAGVLKSTVIQYSNFNDNITPDDAFVSKGTLNNVISGAKLKPTVIQDLPSAGGSYILTMNAYDNYDVRIDPLNIESLTTLTLYFAEDEYASDYSMSFNFNSGSTPTDIVYVIMPTNPIHSIINWVGEDCSMSGTISLFTPQANKHYEVIVYYNGYTFVGEVAGYVTATGNEVS